MLKEQYNIPILFLVYNRLNETKKVFESIKRIKPKKLFLSSDGPKNNSPEDLKKINEIRSYIVNSIDWECDLNLNFSDVNLGCKDGVSSGISWFFKNVEYGVILEDDCLPNKEFFRFMEINLKLYENKNEILMISGHNRFNFKIPFADATFKSKYCSIWGWGTWKNRWSQYDLNIDFWRKEFSSNELRKYFIFKFISTNRFSKQYDEVKYNGFDTWDYQLQCLAFHKKYFCIYPNENLVRNIGFYGTHHKVKTKVHSIYASTNYKSKINLEIDKSKVFDFLLEFIYVFIPILKGKVAGFFKTTTKKLSNKI